MRKMFPAAHERMAVKPGTPVRSPLRAAHTHSVHQAVSRSSAPFLRTHPEDLLKDQLRLLDSAAGPPLSPSHSQPDSCLPTTFPAPPRRPTWCQILGLESEGSRAPHGPRAAPQSGVNTGPVRAGRRPRASQGLPAGASSPAHPSVTPLPISSRTPGPLPSGRGSLGAEAPQADHGLGPPQPAGVLLRPPRRGRCRLPGAPGGGPSPCHPPESLPCSCLECSHDSLAEGLVIDTSGDIGVRKGGSMMNPLW